MDDYGHNYRWSSLKIITVNQLFITENIVILMDDVKVNICFLKTFTCLHNFETQLIKNHELIKNWSAN